MEGINKISLDTPDLPKTGTHNHAYEETKELKDVTKAEPDSHLVSQEKKLDNPYLRLTAEVNHRLRKLLQIYFSYQLEYPLEKKRAKDAVVTELISYGYSAGEQKGLETAFSTALYYLENYHSKDQELVTSDYLDAFYKVDLIRVFFTANRASIAELYLVQVKSREIKSEDALNQDISGYTSIMDTDYNESEREYISQARLLYKKLEGEALEKLPTFNLPDSVKQEIFDKIKNTKLKNSKGDTLNRPETLDEINLSHTKLIADAKEIFTRKEKTETQHVENLNSLINEKREVLIKEIFQNLLLGNSPSLSLESQSVEYLEVFKIFMEICSIQDTEERFEKLAKLYCAFRSREEEINEEVKVKDLATWLELFGSSQAKLESVLNYLLTNKDNFNQVINQRQQLADLEVKSNLITAQKVYSVIAYPDKYRGIVETEPQVIY